MRMLISGFAPAKELGIRANQKIFRIQSDTCGRLKTIRIRCLWTRKFSHPQKNICGKKIPDTCGYGLSLHKRFYQFSHFSGKAPDTRDGEALPEKCKKKEIAK